MSAPLLRADKSAAAKHLGSAKRIDLLVKGATCAGCLKKIETGIMALSGARSARLNLTTGRLVVEGDEALTPTRIADKIVALSYEARPFDPDPASQGVDERGRMLLACLAVSGFAAANIMLLSIGIWAGTGEMGAPTRGFLMWVSAVIALPAIAYSGRPFFISALRALRVLRVNMDVPISLAVILSAGLSVDAMLEGTGHAYFEAATSLLFFLLIGRYLDHRLRYQANSAARDLLSLQSITTRRIGASGDIQSVAAKDIAIGDLILLLPGDRAPVDGVITEGNSDFDLSLVTGESAPSLLKPGAALHGGVLNLSARAVMRATARVEYSLAATLSHLIEAGAQSRSLHVRLADKAAGLYVPIVHTLAALTFVGWWVGADDLRLALTNAIAVLIITCPCALGLAVPAVQIVATGRLFRRGVLVKSGDALERLSEIDTVVFDKTGTLTHGAPQLLDRDVLAPALGDAAVLARLSRHPLAMALAGAAGPGQAAQDAQEQPGRGLSGRVRGEETRLGSCEFVMGDPHSAGDGMELWFQRGDAPPVRFAFEDGLRSDAAATIRALESIGPRIVMLSGDRVGAARRCASELGIKEWNAGLSPRDKVAHLDALAQSGARVLMVGDGLNDTPALARAHVAMSPGTAADASQNAADFVFEGERLSPVVDAIRIARAARRRMIENLWLAALYNALAIPVAIAGFVTPLMAAIAMSSSSLIVTLNALRLNRTRLS